MADWSHFTITFQLIKVKYFPKTVGNGEFTYGVFVFIPLHIITYISSYFMHQQFVFINKSFLEEGEFVSPVTKTYTTFFIGD